MIALRYRETIPTSNLTVLHSDDLQCNSEDVQQIIEKNIGSEVIVSKESIYHELFMRMGGRWTVICREIQNDQSLPVFATRSPLFCSGNNSKVACFAAEF
ncbi:unnamed protein product, partial [Mesorhabditis belari]|uniref:Ground-like domain-containing protein n=1 Tax=Mesorhabditis belari TaxID=2138241 RepID=A0AAF3EKP2_9BILA